MSHAVDAPVRLYGSDRPATVQREALTGGRVPVAVYGLGKIGLPLAAVLADVTGNVTGVDVDEEVVRQVDAGGCPVAREPGLPELVDDVVGTGALHAVADPGEARAAVHVLVVPTLLDDDGRPDLSALGAAVADVAANLSPGDLVVVESTVPPRTTVDEVVPLLAAESGLAPDEFGAAACPERTVSGQALADIRGTHPKVVGGVDPESTRAAALLYSVVTDNDVIEVADAATAESVKVFEGVFRDVNIALANQLARYSEAIDVDVTRAIDVANTQPFCDIHDPGPGVGGHCIPVYPYFLMGAFDVDAPLLAAARAVNDRMPTYTASLLRAVLSDEGVELPGSRVLLLGLTYKANIDELRNAPGVALARQLVDAGATVVAVDPVLGDWSELQDVDRLELEESYGADVDAAVLVTPHDEFDDLSWERFDAPILDGRRALDPAGIDGPVYAVGGRWP